MVKSELVKGDVSDELIVGPFHLSQNALANSPTIASAQRLTSPFTTSKVLLNITTLFPHITRLDSFFPILASLAGSQLPNVFPKTTY